MEFVAEENRINPEIAASYEEEEANVHEFTDLDAERPGRAAARGHSPRSPPSSPSRGGSVDSPRSQKVFRAPSDHLLKPTASFTGKVRPTTPKRDEQTPARSASPPSAEKKKVLVSPSLTRTTQARIHDHERLEEQKRSKEQPKVKISPLGYQPPESLLKTTQARIADIKEWEASKERVNYEDDIWWEQRRPTPTALKLDVPSKLHTLTEAYKHSTRSKHKDHRHTRTPSPLKETSKIDPTSPLLRPTSASTAQSVVGGPPPPTPPHVPKLVAAHTGPQVTSKVHEPTAAALQGQWRSPQKRDSSPPKHVKPPSERLLQPSTASLAASREKARKSPEDPRERGWDLRNLGQSPIPPVEEVFPVPIKTSKRLSSVSRDSIASADLEVLERAIDLLHSQEGIPRGGLRGGRGDEEETVEHVEVQRVDTNISTVTFASTPELLPGH